MPYTHLISGLPCSGKTTYATGLRADLDAALFTLDRWLITLFGKYSIDDVGHEEHVRRVLACRDLIWSAASELLRRGADVILDDGFFLRENRMRVIELSKAIGGSAKVHFVDTPLTVIEARLEVRNASLPPHNFRIGPEMLRAFVGLFEAPGPDEGAELVVVEGESIRMRSPDPNGSEGRQPLVTISTRRNGVAEDTGGDGSIEGR